MKITAPLDGAKHGGMLVLAGGLLLSGSSAAGQGDPDRFSVSVTIRDFTRDHPDFNLTPTTIGWHHGNIGHDLDAHGKPAFIGGGFVASSPWRDRDHNIISPHLFNMCNFAAPVPPDEAGDDRDVAEPLLLSVSGQVRIGRGSVVDGFDSTKGAYGDENRNASAEVRVNGADAGEVYVRVHGKSMVHGHVRVHPGDDPASVVDVDRSSEVTGEVSNLETPLEIEPVELPPMTSPPSVGDLRYDGGVHEITQDLRCASLTARKGAVLDVIGDVTIWCDEKLFLDDRSVLNVAGNVTLRCDELLKLDDGAEINVLEGAALTILAGHRVVLDDRSSVNMGTGNPRLVTVMLPSHPDRDGRVRLDDGSRMAACITGEDARLRVEDGSELFGGFRGRDLVMARGSRVHVDLAGGPGGEPAPAPATEPGIVLFDPQECELGDVPGTPGFASSGDILSAGTFSEWFRDVLGVNLSTVQSLEFTRDASGLYSFIDDNWRPIDGQLMGNEGQVHNYHLTAELEAGFRYDEAAGQFIEVRNTDDCYVFLNGRLVIENGGYGFNKVMYIDFDRMGFADGDLVQLQLFHAQRQQGLAIFRVRTNVVLHDDGAIASVTGILDD